MKKKSFENKCIKTENRVSLSCRRAPFSISNNRNVFLSVNDPVDLLAQSRIFVKEHAMHKSVVMNLQGFINW